MRYPDLPGTPPASVPFGELDPSLSHPFLPSERVGVPDLRAYYAAGGINIPRELGEHWLQIEAAISHRDPGRARFARLGLQTFIDSHNPASEWWGRAALAQRFIPAMAERAAGSELTDTTVNSTYVGLSRMFRAETALQAGAKAEAVVIAASARLSLTEDDPNYFLYLCSPRQSAHPSRLHNHDSEAQDGLPVEIKLTGQQKGTYDKQILKVQLWGLMIRSGLIERAAPKGQRDPQARAALDQLAQIIVGDALYGRPDRRLDALVSLIKEAMDRKRALFPMPPELTPPVIRRRHSNVYHHRREPS